MSEDMSNNNESIIGDVSVKVPLIQYKNVEWLAFREAQIGMDYHCECQIDRDSITFGIDYCGENHKHFGVYHGDINVDIKTKINIKMKNGVLLFEKPVTIQVYRHYEDWNYAKVFVKVL